MDKETLEMLGACCQRNHIYELELIAGILSLRFWSKRILQGLQVWFGDNDAVRFSLIKGSAEGDIGKALIHLKHESLESSQAWFASVPTEANMSDFLPSRGAPCPLFM